MTPLLAANILYPILALTGTLMCAHQNKYAYIVFLFVEALMLYIGIQTAQIGIIVMALVYVVTHVYAYRKWSKLETSIT